MRRIVIFLVVLSTSCGGIFLAPPPPGRECIYDSKKKIVPKDDCNCYYVAGAFSWKRWELLRCPSTKP